MNSSIISNIKKSMSKYNLISISASKILGEWTNEGSCNGDGDDPTCGAGTQLQSRTCTDGTIDKCTVVDTHRSVTCAVAGTALPVCGKIFPRNVCADKSQSVLILTLIMHKFVTRSFFI